MNIALKLVFALAFPVAAFFTGVWLMSLVSNREHGRQQLLHAAEDDREPLNQRFGGYDVAAVDRHWSELARNPRAVENEQRFLVADLLFPFLYGGALAASLVVLWSLLGRRFHLGWVLSPVIVTVLADLTENTLHLNQLGRHLESGRDGLSEIGIGIASVATILKLSLFIASCLIIITMVIMVSVSQFRSVNSRQSA